MRPTALLPLPLACAALAAGCGGGQPTHAGASVAPSSQAPARVVTSIAGTRESPVEVADAAAQKPTGAGPRSELQPLPARAFARPVARYRAYSGREADAMQGRVAALGAALRTNDRAAAQRAWAQAYSRYLRLGAAYGALGDLDQAIDGTPGPLARGVNDPHFSGLHRIERGLWSGAPLDGLVPWAARLARDVHTLRRVVRKVEISPLDYATRAHEILEDAQRDMLSGRSAPWSGAGVQATADSLAATREVLGTLRPVLEGRGDALTQSDTGMDRLGAQLAAIRRAHGGRWPRADRLSETERERLDGALGALLESLSGVPGSLETRLTPTIPTIAAERAERHG